MPDAGSLSEKVAVGSSRRGFLAKVGVALMAVATGRAVTVDEADAYHFCGHIYTTGSCPHPTGLPRIDSRGRPLRARDGRPVDDLGRPVDRAGRPVDATGRPLLDPDGAPLPPAPRTPLCAAVGDRYGLRTTIDGSWHRCCGGKVRKLIDCCARTRNRINGDRALTGYCYRGRKVFCVMYYDTNVDC
jgi:hypothetical protein